MWYSVFHHLMAYLRRNAGKLRVGGKGGEIIHSFYQRGRGHSAPLAILIWEISIQGLRNTAERSHLLKHRNPHA